MQAKRQNHFTPKLLALAIAAASAPAWAATVPLGADGEIRYNFTAGYTLAKRLGHPAAALTTNGAFVPVIGPNNQPIPGVLQGALANSDDGDLNFKKGALVNNRISLLGEADIRYNATQGVFLRAQAFYDDVYHGKNDNNSPNTVNRPAGAPNKEFAPETRSAAGGQARFMDAYWYGDFQVNDTSALNLKVGRHVVQWGESLFFANAAAAQSPIDATKAVVPGAQVKDFTMPVGQVSANYSVNDKWMVMGYAQYEFKEMKLPAVGSYFSPVDILGPGAETMITANIGGQTLRIPRLADIKARKGGQWGLGTRYRATMDTELSLYHLRYHNRTPTLVVNTATPGAPGPTNPPVSYAIKYMEDVKLTGASVSTRLGDFAVAGELTVRTNAPVMLTNQDTKPGRVIQTNLNTTYVIGPMSVLTGGANLAAEISNSRLTSSYGSVANSSPTQLAVYFEPTYPNIFPGWGLKVPVYYSHAFGDDRTRILSIGSKFTYLDNLELGVFWNNYLGKPHPVNRPGSDRDYLAFTAKYNF